MECVYLIKDSQSGLHKIGMTKNWERRKKQLKVGSVTKKIKIVRCMNSQKWEKVLHAMFNHKRIPQSEWFRIGEEEAVSKMEWLADITNKQMVRRIRGNWKLANQGHYYRRRKSRNGYWYTEQKSESTYNRDLDFEIRNVESRLSQESRKESGYWPSKGNSNDLVWSKKDPTCKSNNFIYYVFSLILIYFFFLKDISYSDVEMSFNYLHSKLIDLKIEDVKKIYDQMF